MHNSGEEERDARWSPDDPKGQECPNRGEPIGVERVHSVPGRTHASIYDNDSKDFSTGGKLPDILSDYVKS